MRRAIVAAALAATVAGCSLIPVKPVRERRQPRVKCERALIFYGDPRTGEITRQEWGKVCSDGKITLEPLPWFVRLYLTLGAKLEEVGVVK